MQNDSTSMEIEFGSFTEQKYAMFHIENTLCRKIM